MTLQVGDRVKDNAGDTGTITRIDGDTVYVDGDTGTIEWLYWKGELVKLEDERSVAALLDLLEAYGGPDIGSSRSVRNIIAEIRAKLGVL